MFTRSQFNSFINDLPRKPNDFQLKVLESIAFGSGNIVVSALAGSGKTTLLVQTADLFKQMGVTSVGYLAFNVSIRNELNERLPKPYAAINSHSLGMQVLKVANPKTKVNTNKWSGIAKGIMSAIGVESHLQYTAGKAFQALCSKVMLNMVDPDDFGSVAAIKEQYALDTVTEPMILAVADAIADAKLIWERTGEINFDEMLYWPVVLKLEPPKHDFLLVDEAQDLNLLQQELSFRSVNPGGRLVYVGDKAQCQPAGTMVRMADGTDQPIETLKQGDKVVSYDRRSGHWMRRGIVTKTAKRPYSGLLYTVSACGKTTQATENHKWLVKWENMNSGKWITYIMRKGIHWRVGIVQMFNQSKLRRENKFLGLSARMNAEKADDGWIIGVHDSYVKAYSHEQITSTKYGLTQVTFRPTNSSRLTQSEIDYIHSSIPTSLTRVDQCLKDHGRNIQYPLIRRGAEQQRRGGSTYFVTESCNLIPGLMSVPISPDPIIFHPKTPFMNDFGIIDVSTEMFNGEVYSLEVDRYELYVANGILTHNSIYAFAGADAISFQRIIQKTNAVVLPLNVCYRCPTSHLDLARKLVPAIEARPNAPAGTIEYIDPLKVPTLAKPGALIMCRLTAPLVSLYFKLIQNKIRSKVMGKDIGAQLISIMEKVAKYEGFRYEKAIEFLEKYREHQVMMLMQRENSEQQIENVNDQVETLVVCITNFDSAKTLQMLKDVLEDLFGDQDKENWKSMVTLCTVHRAKGLEAETTFLLKPDKMPLVWKDQKPSDYEQELNILYVALTRSKETMYVCGELHPMLGNLREHVEAKLKQDEVAQPALPLQPALLELPAPAASVSAKFTQTDDKYEVGTPVPEPDGYGPRIEAFIKPSTVEVKPIEITPVVVSSTHTFPVAKQRAGYSKRVMDAFESMSTGELMQLAGVLEAILEDRNMRNEVNWKELSS